ncbi:hypothetical protein Chor_016005 [Crotalus horridus]
MPFGTLLLKMAADSEPESEVFEITDFTTASEWEKFISRVEEVLNDWKLINISSGEPLEKRYKYALPVAMQDLLCMNNDFPPRAHCLVRCQVPVFVQIHHRSRKMYVGECQGPGVRTDFEMVHLRKVPSQYSHLSGLLDIFKSKIGCPLTPLPAINISIRLTYILQDWQQYFWPQQPPDIDALVGGEVGGVEFGKLPFGACEDPISELHLAAIWPHLTEGIIVDNDVYSDLDPAQAPQWSVRVRKADNPQCLLSDFVTEFFKLCRRKESTDEILGRSAFEEEGKDADISHALSKLTEPAPVPIHKLSVTNMVHTAKKKIRKHRGIDESPLNNEVLNTVLMYLFPDAVDKSADGSEARTNASTGSIPPPDGEDSNLYIQFKSAPSDSLTYKLALCLCMINFYHGGVKGVAHLWQEFVLEMRYRWENNFFIPGLSSSAPDLRCCLLHQKLQMLNCCIERKKARDEGKKMINLEKQKDAVDPKESDKEKGEVGKSWESWSDSEEEFFECLSDTEELKGNGQEGGKKGIAKERTSPYDRGSVRRTVRSTGQAGNAANPGCCLEDFVRWYSPRDYIEEETVDEKGGVVIKGELSARMKIPSNMWVEAWETAKPVPARRQRRLFDDTREAEKVLHYLAIQKPADLARHLLSCVIHAAVLKVKEEESLEEIGLVKKTIKQIISHSSKVLRFPNPEDKKLEEIIGQIMNVEATIARARSLKAKFGIEKCSKEEERKDLEKFVNSFLEQPEVSVVGAGRGPAGIIIHKLFVNAQRVATMMPYEEELKRSGSMDEKRLNSGMSSDFPPPAGREVILRTTVPRPAPYSKPLPQRMYSVLTKDDFRLAGAFSSDTTFF